MVLLIPDLLFGLVREALMDPSAKPSTSLLLGELRKNAKIIAALHGSGGGQSDRLIELDFAILLFDSNHDSFQLQQKFRLHLKCFETGLLG